MARVTVEDCVDKVPNRFDLVLLAAHRARMISSGSQLTIDRDNDKNPVVSLREIADTTALMTMVDGKSKTLLGTGSAGHVVLKADATAAECTDVPVCVQGFVAINFVVKIGYASEVIWVSVKK